MRLAFADVRSGELLEPLNDAPVWYKPGWDRKSARAVFKDEAFAVDVPRVSALAELLLAEPVMDADEPPIQQFNGRELCDMFSLDIILTHPQRWQMMLRAANTVTPARLYVEFDGLLLFVAEADR